MGSTLVVMTQGSQLRLKVTRAEGHGVTAAERCDFVSVDVTSAGRSLTHSILDGQRVERVPRRRRSLGSRRRTIGVLGGYLQSLILEKHRGRMRGRRHVGDNRDL